MNAIASRLCLIGLATGLAGGCSLMPWADGGEGEGPVLEAEPPRGSVIEPEVERREVTVPRIDTENFEIGLYAGVLSVEDFGADPVYGVRAAYHVTEDFFLEGAYAASQVSDSSFRRVGLPIFPEEEEDLTTYSFSLGYNFLPGEVFVGTRYAMTSAMYFIAGAGNTEFVDESRLTYDLGFGLRVLPRDWLSLRLEAKDNIFESDLLGENEFKHNFELNLGFAFFF
ncbi:MAG: outer membrane beta-barrel domain-containing protein [Gammaproteobacteria bacterium]